MHAHASFDKQSTEELFQQLLEEFSIIQEAVANMAAKLLAQHSILQVIIKSHSSPLDLFESYSSLMDALTARERMQLDLKCTSELASFQMDILDAINKKKN